MQVLILPHKVDCVSVCRSLLFRCTLAPPGQLSLKSARRFLKLWQPHLLFVTFTNSLGHLRVCFSIYIFISHRCKYHHNNRALGKWQCDMASASHENIPWCFHRPISGFINLGSFANSQVESHLKIDSLTFRSFISFVTTRKGFATAARAQKHLNGWR